MYNILLTCEHGGNDVPLEYQHLFEDARHVLETHRGWDIGILPFAEEMARWLKAPLISSTVSRLLVELNRSLGHRQLFSEFSEQLPKVARQDLLQKYYFPHRDQVGQAVRRSLEYGRVFHITVHSFTPELNGQVRNADVTFLYDYRRPEERRLSVEWQKELESRMGVRVRRNYPYRGHTDGLTTSLRKHWGADEYIGICIEVNQKHLESGHPEGWPEAVSEGLLSALKRFHR
ncbi:MAG: N-formylglutamate amidohydrolase [Vulcanimicrobiota bacterium]